MRSKKPLEIAHCKYDPIIGNGVSHRFDPVNNIRFHLVFVCVAKCQCSLITFHICSMNGITVGSNLWLCCALVKKVSFPFVICVFCHIDHTHTWALIFHVWRAAVPVYNSLRKNQQRRSYHQSPCAASQLHCAIFFSYLHGSLHLVIFIISQHEMCIAWKGHQSFAFPISTFFDSRAISKRHRVSLCDSETKQFQLL